ncbi:MAG: RDD family protein [Bacteroidia bacterium]
MNTIVIPTAQNIELEYPQAGIGARALATIIDLAVLIGYMLILNILGYSVSSEDEVMLTFMVPAMVYSLVCESVFNGQTLGKFVMKTRVISMDGASPSFSQYVLRWILRLLDIWILTGLVGLVTMAVNKNGQRLGDIIAGTTVIKLKLVTHFGDTIFMETNENYQVVFPQIRNLSDRDVSILKEVLDAGLKSSNPEILEKLSRKVQEVAGIESNMRAAVFLETVLLDYNHLYGGE